MKRVGNLFEPLTEFSNLHLAAKKALKGAHGSQAAMEFYFNLENEIYDLQRELLSDLYQPGPYTYFYITDPKERKISVAPFRDRNRGKYEGGSGTSPCIPLQRGSFWSFF